MPRKVVVVMSGRGYRAPDYIAAARGLRVELVIAADVAQTMMEVRGDRFIRVDFDRPDWSAGRIAERAADAEAVVAADDAGVIVAAHAAELLGLAGNPPEAAAATRDKALMRRLLAAAGVAQPEFALAAPGLEADAAARIGYPAVVKPRSLSASRGVIRVDDPAALRQAVGRIRDGLGLADEVLLIERFVSGPELTVEGLVRDGELEVLAHFDKPDPLEGPFFEETMFVTPSRHDPAALAEVDAVVAGAVGALGIVTGPIHAELRLEPDRGPQLVEVAARTIGGHCGRALVFGLLGESLETVVLRAALSLPAAATDLALPASGALMIPIPGPGVLRGVYGVEDARAVPGVTDVELTLAPGSVVRPLPEGDRYLGFVFAAGATPDDVEAALRKAGAMVQVHLEPASGGDEPAASC